MEKEKKYTAVIEVDDDRWAKHPFGFKIMDEEGNVVSQNNYLDDWEDCYKVIRKYNCVSVTTEYY